jgi:hypothetical protein
MNAFNFETSIKQTANFMLESKKTEFDMLESVRIISSPFGIISKKLTGRYCFNTAMRLHSRWKRNQQGN